MYSPKFLFISAESLSLTDSQDVERQQVEAPDGQQAEPDNAQQVEAPDVGQRHLEEANSVIWGSAHAYYASMGGFIFDAKGGVGFPFSSGRHLLPPDCAFSQNTPVN